MAICLPSESLEPYRRFSRYNSPYPAHDDGRAIDLYPEGEDGVAPVGGVVRETRTVGCPDRTYASPTDHLIVIDLDDEWCRRTGAKLGSVARVLHVIPDVDPGDRVSVGDALGPTTRSGFFGQWVDKHVHLGFRPPESDPLRASGSLPIHIDVPVRDMAWDGTGSVVETGPTHAVLDAPTHPDPGRSFAAIASDGGVPLDGGLAHYAGGGTFTPVAPDEALSLCGTRVATGVGVDREHASRIEWEPIEVTANGERIVGLSLFAARDARYGAKLVCPDCRFDVGESVSIRIETSADPVRFGSS